MPEYRLSRAELRQRLPDADPANLRRGIRSLARMRLVREEIEDDTIDPGSEEWGPRWVILTPHGKPPPRDPELDALLRELLALAGELEQVDPR